MAIITFWGSTKKQTNQTASLIGSALQMGIDRNLKILLVDGTFNSKEINRAFNQKEEKKQNAILTSSNLGQVDISSGIEALLSAVSSNKTSPEIIKNYTVPLLTGRLDVLYGMKTEDKTTFNTNLKLFKDMLVTANQYYDLIYLDLEKGELIPEIIEILKISDIIVYPFEQRVEFIEKFEELWGNVEPLENKNKVIPLITREDRFSKYNSDNMARRFKIKPTIPSIIYNTLFMEALQEGKVMQLFFNLNNQSVTYRNNYFIQTISDLNEFLIDRIQLLQSNRI